MASRDGVERKLAWARSLAHRLHDDVLNHEEQHPISVGRRERAGRCDFVARGVVPVPGDWPLRMGNAIANLRSSLDHLVWFLAGRRAHRRSEFVIADHSKDYKYLVNDMDALAGLDDQARDWIHLCQPFHPDALGQRTPQEQARAELRWSLGALESEVCLTLPRRSCR